MRRVFLGTRQTNGAAQHLVGRRWRRFPLRQHDGIFILDTLTGRNTRRCRYGSSYAVVPELQSEFPEGLSPPGAFLKHPMRPGDLKPLRDAGPEATQLSPQEGAIPLIPSDFYGKWRSLSLDQDLLRIESDIESPPTDRQLLVDQPGNENDILLWMILLRYRCQRMGLKGALTIWEGVNKRQTLHEVHGIVAEAFWQTILKHALQDKVFLESVWLYALWLDESHGVKVPKLYTTVISFFLGEAMAHEVLLWNVRLNPRFGPGRTDFLGLIRTYVKIPNTAIRRAVKALYIAGNHRDLYDDIVPYLYSLGLPALARYWRNLLVLHNDWPMTTASKQFLRYVEAYYPQVELVEREISVAELRHTEDKPALTIANGLDMEAQPGSGMGKEHSPLSYLMNRVHGATFGIQEKSLSDVVVARWFASSWISLNLAIAAIHALGVNVIGPLSLQSIALREVSAAGILSRIAQLQGLQIGIGTSNYSKAIRYLARNNDSETLQSLLQSDLHPDVFESKEMQESVFQSCSLTGDWENYHLIGVVNLAASVDAAFLLSNELLLASLVDENKQMIIQILNDMRARDVDIFPSTSHSISWHIRQNIGLRKGDVHRDTDFWIALCRQLAGTRFPPAGRAWEKILWHLGRNDRFDDLENIALEITRLFTTRAHSKSPFMYVHKFDTPWAEVNDMSQSEHYVSIPRELAIGHKAHPVQGIFNPKLQRALVRFAFNYELRHNTARLPVLGKRSQPSDFYIARGVRLLRLLKDQGLHVQPEIIKSAVYLRLADLYGPTHGPTVGLDQIKYANRLTLPETKRLFEDAWGGQFLGTLSQIEEFISDTGNRRVKAYREQKEARPAHRPASRPVFDRPGDVPSW